MSTERIPVLVVDDHALFARSLELLLSPEESVESMGTASTGEEAVEMCRRRCPSVVLMDVDLPGMDGIEATRRIREICPHAQVVVIAALQTTDILWSAVEAGACGFVPKSSAADQLVRVVHRAATLEMVVPEGHTWVLLERLALAREHRPEAGSTDALAHQEVELLQGIAEGESTPELAARVSIDPEAVPDRVRGILTKLEARSRLEAVLLGLRAGIITAGR